MPRFTLSRWLTSQPALGLALLFVACSGCMPSKYSARDLEEAKAFVTKRLETRPPRSHSQPRDSTVVSVRWLQSPYVGGGNDSIMVYGDIETIDNHGVHRAYVCSARLSRRPDKQWNSLIKIQDQKYVTGSWDDAIKRAAAD